MNKQMVQESLLKAETSIREELVKFGMEYAELSPRMREILASCYIRGGIDAMVELKKDVPDIQQIRQ